MFILASLAPLLTWLIVGVLSGLLVAVGPSNADFSVWSEALTASLLQFARSLVVVALFSSIAVAAAFITKSVVVTVISAMLFLLFNVLVPLLMMLGMLDQYVVLLPFGWVNEWLGGSDRSLSGESVEHLFSISITELQYGLLSIVVSVALIFLTVTLFTRRDIKEG